MAEMIFEGVCVFGYEDSRTHLVCDVITDEDFNDPIDYSLGDVPLPIRNYVSITSENERTKDHTALRALARKRVRVTVEVLRDLNPDEVMALIDAFGGDAVNP